MGLCEKTTIRSSYGNPWSDVRAENRAPYTDNTVAAIDYYITDIRFGFHRSGPPSTAQLKNDGTSEYEL